MSQEIDQEPLASVSPGGPSSLAIVSDGVLSHKISSGHRIHVYVGSVSMKHSKDEIVACAHNLAKCH